MVSKALAGVVETNLLLSSTKSRCLLKTGRTISEKNLFKTVTFIFVISRPIVNRVLKQIKNKRRARLH